MADQLLTSERRILQDYLTKGAKLPTEVRGLMVASYKNPVGEIDLGAYRSLDRRKVATADVEILESYRSKMGELPSFREAGPRELLAFKEPGKSEDSLRVGVVTAGGLAPGLNSVVHSIVERHLKTYRKLLGDGGEVWGFMESFRGLAGRSPTYMALRPEITETWLHKGGCELGAIRFRKHDLPTLAKIIADNLRRWGVRILYVIGGDGTLTTAHHIATQSDSTIVVGIPKTMDNDILWVWQSFGFNTAVDRAAAFITTMHAEAEGTRRVAVLEFFGARSGFVAANAALASGHVDLVLVPEVFESLTKAQAEEALDTYREYLAKTIRRKKEKPHAVIVIAEGVGKVLQEMRVEICGKPIVADDFPNQFKDSLQLVDMSDEPVTAFTIQPRHYIRAIPANSHDEIYCKRLGALSVDNALAGYTDFMISQWLTEYVLVPLELVAEHQKHVPTGGIFWKQVVASTGQPADVGITSA